MRNVIKTDNRKARRSGDVVSAPPSKRSKKDPTMELLRRYPVSASNLNIEDPASVQLHLKGIEEEMKRAKPRDTVLLPLLRTTFGERRLFVLNDASNIKEIRDCYPALTIPAVVSYCRAYTCNQVCINWESLPCTCTNMCSLSKSLALYWGEAMQNKTSPLSGARSIPRQ